MLQLVRGRRGLSSHEEGTLSRSKGGRGEVQGVRRHAVLVRGRRQHAISVRGMREGRHAMGPQAAGVKPAVDGSREARALGCLKKARS